MSQDITYHTLTSENMHRLRDAEVFDNPVDPTQLAAFVAEPRHALVFAETADRVVGFASGTLLLHPDKAPIFFLNEVGVEEDIRRRGIAKELCVLLMARARAMGCKGIWLATEIDNVAARALYRSLAAGETEGIVVYDWDGVMDA